MKGLLCPVCNTKLHSVLITRGSTRRRQCYNGHRFTTEETIVAVDDRGAKRKALKRLREAEKTLQQIAQQIDTSIETVRSDIKSLSKGTSK